MAHQPNSPKPWDLLSLCNQPAKYLDLTMYFEALTLTRVKMSDLYKQATEEQQSCMDVVILGVGDIYAPRGDNLQDAGPFACVMAQCILAGQIIEFALPVAFTTNLWIMSQKPLPALPKSDL